MAKKSNGPAMKARWAQIKKVADILDVNQQAVQMTMYLLKGEGIVEKIINGDHGAIKRAHELIAERGKSYALPGKRHRVVALAARPAPVAAMPPKPTTAVEKLKLAFWFIDQIGGAVEAETIVEAAARAVKAADEAAESGKTA